MPRLISRLTGRYKSRGTWETWSTCSKAIGDSSHTTRRTKRGTKVQRLEGLKASQKSLKRKRRNISTNSASLSTILMCRQCRDFWSLGRKIRGRRFALTGTGKKVRKIRKTLRKKTAQNTKQVRVAYQLPVSLKLRNPTQNSCPQKKSQKFLTMWESKPH